MKRPFIFVVTALLAGAWFYSRFLASPAPDSVPAPPASVSSAARSPLVPAASAVNPGPRARPLSTARTLTAPAPLPAEPGARPPGAPNPYAQPPHGTVVEFENVNGMAIAFGDILLGKIDESSWHGKRGRYETGAPQLWDKPEIPYRIATDLANPKRVEQAVEYFRQNTPVRFIPYSGQPDAILFETGEENCLSGLGRVGGVQPIKLSPKCAVPEILHEMMHALGFIHEQSRPDRDQYVEVLWANIQGEYQSQYAMMSDTFTEAERGAPFDYHSIMLYRPDTFAVAKGEPTLRSLGTETVSPSTEGLSPEDIRRLNRLYGQPGQ